MNDSYITNDFDAVPNAKQNPSGLLTLVVVPLVDTVVYPNVITPIPILSKRAAAAVQHAMSNRLTVLGLAQRNPDLRTPQAKDLYIVGTELALSRTQIPFRDGTDTVLAQGRRRVQVVNIVQQDPYILAEARVLRDDEAQGDEADMLARTVLEMFNTVSEISETITDEVLDFASTIFDYGALADFVASTLPLTLEERQQVLEMSDVAARLRVVAALINRELNLLELREDIAEQVQSEMSKNQREAFLREQVRVIQNELAEGDPFQQDLAEIRRLVEEAVLTPEVRERANKELTRLAMMPPMAPEVGIIRTYLDWIVGLPWVTRTEDVLDLAHAQRVLDEDHYGLKKIKDRILEHIAVRKLAADKTKAPILCFVGPPGVGKTSLGRSIARALGRKFVRVSLGGLRDEAEIRGHRRTYIGALPGRVLQTMKRAGTVNPVFMLDEIDKLGQDFRGDPASALLEVLDPEQNNAFSDHYLDLDYDLSKVFFITTANDLSTLPEALLDRLEVIEFAGYTEEEKTAIAQQYLVPEQLKATGIESQSIRFSPEALRVLVREYTYEAGVRNLNREVGNVCRKLARQVAEGKRAPKRVTPDVVHTLLGAPLYLEGQTNRADTVGLVTGLAWTPGGGDTLSIEVSILPGKGTLMLTGSLGEVMQESAQAAMSYTRSRAAEFNVPDEDFEEYDVHVHIPEGAVPKDGPSAGITLATAIISAFTERKVRAAFAMTGEITLRGRVLPVGGIKEKVLAAHRAKLNTVILPKPNEKDLQDIPPKTLQSMTIHLVESMQDVLDLVLLEAPAERLRDQLLKEKDKKKKPESKKKAKSETPEAETPAPAPKPRKRKADQTPAEDEQPA
ncbi:MAG: endopeptidase La [Anaerolineae bacterium]|nr:endopeptidase La [Anaerolineae bacterium]